MKKILHKTRLVLGAVIAVPIILAGACLMTIAAIVCAITGHGETAEGISRQVFGE